MFNDFLSTVSESPEVITESTRTVWSGALSVIPTVFFILIIFIAGWALATILGGVVYRLFKSLKLDNMLKSVGIEDTITKAGFKLDTGAFFGALVKWFVIVIFLIAALELLNLTQVTVFLQGSVLPFLSDIVVAALILIVGALLAHTVQRLVTGAAKAAESPSSSFMGGVAKWSIWIFTIIAALGRLGVASAELRTIFIGLVAMIAIAGGLAFGLGGRDAAASYLDKLRRDIN